MMTPIPGSFAVPMLGVPSTLASIDTHAVAAAALCVGASLLLASVVMYLERRPRRTSRAHSWGMLAERSHLLRHAA